MQSIKRLEVVKIYVKRIMTCDVHTAQYVIVSVDLWLLLLISFLSFSLSPPPPLSVFASFHLSPHLSPSLSLLPSLSLPPYLPPHCFPAIFSYQKEH